MGVRRNIRLLGWFYFLSEFRLYGAVAILYYTQVSGSFALGMSVYSIAQLASSVFELPTGVVSDLVGRKVTVILGAFAGTAAVTFYAFGGSYPPLVIGAALEGLARAFFSGNNDALLYDTLAEIGQPEAFQEYLGKVSFMVQVALAIAVVIGSLIATVSFPLMMWLSVVPQALSILVALGFLEPKIHARTESNVYAHLRTAILNFLHNARLRNLSMASILEFAFSEGTFQYRAAFIALLWPVWAIGLSGLIAHALGAVGFYVAGRTIKRFGEFRLLVGGISFSQGARLLVALVPGVLSPAVILATDVFYGINSVATSGLMQREFTTEQRATMGSLASLGGSLTFAAFSFALGGLADRIGVVMAFAIATLLGFVPIFFYWRAFRHPAAEAVGIGR
jgi:MFS family permease